MEKKRKKTIVFCTILAVTLVVVLVTVGSCQIVNKGQKAEHLDVAPILDKIVKFENSNFKDEEDLKKQIDETIKNNMIKAEVKEIKTRETNKYSYQIKLNSTSKMLILDNNRDVLINVTFGKAENLSDVISVRELGKLENSDKEIVINRLVEKNSNLRKEFISVEINEADAIETANYNVKVTSTDSDIYIGEVNDIKFTVDINNYQEDLTYYIDSKTGEEKSIKGSAPEGVKEIVQIGFDDNFKAYKMPVTVVKVPNWISPKIKSLSNLFEWAEFFNGDISKWDTSNVTNMNSIFLGAKKFNQPLNEWNVLNVTDMGSMFYGALNFNQVLSSWKVQNVKDMSFMFFNTHSFEQNAFHNWNVSSVINMDHMFSSALNFNADISGWNVINVKKYDNFDENTPKWSRENKPRAFLNKMTEIIN